MFELFGGCSAERNLTLFLAFFVSAEKSSRIDRSTSETRKYQRADRALILLHRLENVSRYMFAMFDRLSVSVIDFLCLPCTMLPSGDPACIE